MVDLYLIVGQGLAPAFFSLEDCWGVRPRPPVFVNYLRDVKDAVPYKMSLTERIIVIFVKNGERGWRLLKKSE